MSIEIPDQAVKAADLWGGQIPSSNLEEALYEALPFIAGAIYADLRARLGELASGMHVAGKDHSTGDERKRYYAKAEGMRMAISAIDNAAAELSTED
ncbi:hypothetical protein [Kineosporia succinea]|uniref:Excreted virulence factor EspC (Type VII ESX diderm) n=1 Tax=Kineosporia succinea TaxID=84632 RepID=A0ABT9P9M4_9ACTN|nr:hypothetical protein [Kineosporia succinea]MDP9829399.1 hypothetical protein [Kineosporia succinea]